MRHISKSFPGVKALDDVGFSVAEGVQPPPSLVNIFKEIESDLAHEDPQRQL